MIVAEISKAQGQIDFNACAEAAGAALAARHGRQLSADEKILVSLLSFHAAVYDQNRFDGIEKGPEGLALTHGVFFKPRRADKRLMEACAGLMQARYCFANCLALAGVQNRWIYCEGYAIVQSQPIPVHHAWVADADSGAILDPTWAGWLGEAEIKATAYLGIPFTFRGIYQHIAGWKSATEGSAAILNQHDQDYPFLRMPAADRLKIIHRGDKWKL